MATVMQITDHDETLHHVEVQYDHTNPAGASYSKEEEAKQAWACVLQAFSYW